MFLLKLSWPRLPSSFFVFVLPLLLAATSWTKSAGAEPSDVASTSSSPGEQQAVLYTVAPGQSTLERYGHSLLCIEGAGAKELDGSSRCYDFGVFSEGMVGEVVTGSLKGRAMFVPKVQSLKRSVLTYRTLDRSIFRQVLPLSDQQRSLLTSRLEEVVQAKQAYSYHPTRKNCSTEVRDLINEVTSGKLKNSGQGRGKRTTRSLAEEGFSGRVLLLAAMNLFVGSAADELPSAWERAFLPLELRDLLTETLGAKPEVVYQQTWSPLPTSVHAGRGLLAVLGLLLAGLVLVAARKGGVFKTVSHHVVGIVLALPGILGLGLRFYSSYPEFSSSWAPLLLLPTDLCLGFLTERARMRYVAARLGVVFLLTVFSMVGFIAQPLLWVGLFAALPLASVVWTAQGKRRADRLPRQQVSRPRLVRDVSKVAGALALAAFPLACNDDDKVPPVDIAEVLLKEVARHEGAAFMSVHGTSAKDVWAVGADDGTGPIVLHYDGDEWERRDTGYVGDLWWVQALDKERAFLSGSDAHILSYENGEFTRLTTPGLGKHIVFGLWASGPTDLYAVGSVSGRNGFIWHYDGEEFSEIAIPDELIREDRDVPPLFKVDGRSSDDVWIVGGDGAVMRGNAADGFAVVPSGTDERLFTIDVDEEEILIVGGSSSGLVLSAQMSEGEVEFRDLTPEGAKLLQGADLAGDLTCVVGRDGTVYRRVRGMFEAMPTAFETEVESLHAVWSDPDGGVWAVGGEVITGGLDGGLVVHGNRDIPLWTAPPVLPDVLNACPKEGVDPTPDESIARRWNEQLLGAIRRDTPRPTVHARNLLHTSMAMWDAWAAYDDVAVGTVVRESLTSDDVAAAREEAISYASYRVLSHRYSSATGGAKSQNCFDAFMETLGYDPTDTETEGDSPRALGNRIGAEIIESFADDGANEAENYADPTGFAPDGPVLIVEQPGTFVEDPTQWQRLLLEESVTQNGIPEGGGVQGYIGAHWKEVTPFALVRTQPEAPYFTGEDPPLDLDDEVVLAAVEVVRKTSELDIDDGVMMDISPAGYGNNTLGANDGTGYAENPVTGEAYEPQMVKRGDFTRVLAEYWADGPASETPPGHWNTVANSVSDHPEVSRALYGAGEELDPLAWDVHVYLALNGALHDAAIAAWELKRVYTTARPITLIRYLCGEGQRTDPDEAGFNENGIPLEEDLIEVITEASAASGERHEHLARYVGEVAVRSWRGEPGDRKTEVGGVGWIRCADWIPYQRRTFVTPAFPGYVSGHSTFSRAGAEVLTVLTGSEYFPGGLGSDEREPGYLFFEFGPSEPILLQWATYYDAADQAGQSRLWGGIHIRHDDFDGRRIGSAVGAAAASLAQTYFDGTAP